MRNRQVQHIFESCLSQEAGLGVEPTSSVQHQGHFTSRLLRLYPSSLFIISSSLKIYILFPSRSFLQFLLLAQVPSSSVYLSAVSPLSTTLQHLAFLATVLGQSLHVQSHLMDRTQNLQLRQWRGDLHWRPCCDYEGRRRGHCPTHSF